jgi:4-hydroxyphenylacetate 3-monooxygenase
MLHFTDERGASVQLTPEAFIIAGYTGRDRAMVQKHIDELEREGIAPPPEVPMWYEMPLTILTTAGSIEVASPKSCGEVEPVIGSDHTARDVEREDIATSKRVCPKPLGRTIARIGTLDAAFDVLKLESWIDGEAYQSGTVAQLVPLATLLDGFRTRTKATSFALYCGTVPLLTHGFRFGTKFSARISGGPLAAPLTLDYTTTVQERK